MSVTADERDGGTSEEAFAEVLVSGSRELWSARSSEAVFSMVKSE